MESPSPLVPVVVEDEVVEVVAVVVDFRRSPLLDASVELGTQYKIT